MSGGLTAIYLNGQWEKVILPVSIRNSGPVSVSAGGDQPGWEALLIMASDSSTNDMRLKYAYKRDTN